MANMTMGSETGRLAPITMADGTPLKRQLAISMRRARMKAFLLTAPLLFFILISFVFPIGSLLSRSVHNDVFATTMPNVSAALVDWEPSDGIPDEDAFAILVKDLASARESRNIGRAGIRINYEYPGASSLFKSSSRRALRMQEPPFKDQLIAIDQRWNDIEMWSAMKYASASYSADFYLKAVDMTRTSQGITPRDEDFQIYVKLFWRTAWMSAFITFVCLLLAYPIAYWMSVLPMRTSNLLMILVLLPFWTSLLVRTTAWIAMLQSQGIVNDMLVWANIIADENRLSMMYNRTGAIIAMVHILLPFMVLPLYSVMKTIPPSYVRAAKSLGATNTTAFLRVYFPQTIPGIAAGTLLVFILAVGYYITPALVGGQDGQLISNIIAFHMQSSLNWSLAAALGGILLGGVLIFYWLYNKLVGIDKLRFG